MLYEIKDIYKYNKEESKKMLSMFDSSEENDFWKPYRDNYVFFDRIFMKKYRSWFPMDQKGTLEEVSEEFASDVWAWLKINDKRYSELYRIQTITDDEKYSLTDNVYEHEIIDKDTSSSGSNVKGSETITDTTTNQYGQQSDSESKSASFAQKTIDEDISKTYGTATKTIESGTSAFNESGYSDTDKSVESDATRTDTEDNTVTHGSHTDTETNSYTHGTHTDNLSNTRTEGQRTDTNTGTGTEDVERTRSGNIGVRTVDEMLNIHKDMWVDFSFYEMIFAEIARELLRGC